jgi:hypothetical protein
LRYLEIYACLEIYVYLLALFCLFRPLSGVTVERHLTKVREKKAWMSKV